MRIAHVSDCFMPRMGGIERQVHDLALRQQAAGHDVEIITSVSGGDSATDDFPVLVHRPTQHPRQAEHDPLRPLDLGRAHRAPRQVRRRPHARLDLVAAGLRQHAGRDPGRHAGRRHRPFAVGQRPADLHQREPDPALQPAADRLERGQLGRRRAPRPAPARRPPRRRRPGRRAAERGRARRLARRPLPA